MQPGQELAHLMLNMAVLQPSLGAAMCTASQPTSPCPTLSVDAEPTCNHTETILCSVQYDATKSAL